jgi:hypothetical protein
VYLRNGLLKNRLIYGESISLLYLPITITITFVACKHHYFNPPKVWTRILSTELCLLMIFLNLLVTKETNMSRTFKLGYSCLWLQIVFYFTVDKMFCFDYNQEAVSMRNTAQVFCPPPPSRSQHWLDRPPLDGSFV